MPPYFVPPYFDLARLPITTRAALTVFCLSIAAAVIFVGLVYFPRLLGDSAESSKNMLKEEIGAVDALRRHFHPEEVTRRAMRGEKPEDIETAVAEERRAQLRRAYDVIHPHSFLMPVVFFILCHLTEMTPARRRRPRIALYAGCGVCMIATVFMPLTLLYAPECAPVSYAALYLMLAGFLFMSLIPLLHVWRPIRPAPMDRANR